MVTRKEIEALVKYVNDHAETGEMTAWTIFEEGVPMQGYLDRIEGDNLVVVEPVSYDEWFVPISKITDYMAWTMCGI